MTAANMRLRSPGSRRLLKLRRMRWKGSIEADASTGNYLPSVMVLVEDLSKPTLVVCSTRCSMIGLSYRASCLSIVGVVVESARDVIYILVNA